MTLATRAAFALACLVLFAAPALAQAPATATVIPWGDTLAGVLVALAPAVAQIAVAFAILAFTWLGRHLPAAAVNGIKETLTDAKITRAVNYAFAAAEGVVKGQTLQSGHVNQLTTIAMRYMEQMAPALAKQLVDTLGPMIIAKISSMTPVEAAGTPEAALPVPAKADAFIKVPA